VKASSETLGNGISGGSDGIFTEKGEGFCLALKDICFYGSGLSFPYY
jgi:hypothetical protein